MQSRLILFLLYVTSVSQSAVAQPLRRPVAAQYANFGAYSATQADVFSSIANHASLAQLKNPQAAIYGERRFLLNEMSQYAAVIGVPVRPGAFGLEAGYFGSAHYNETKLGLAYARRLNDKVDLGVQFNYNGIKLAGYGSDAAVGFEAGTVFHLTPQLHTGFHVSNPVGGKFGKDRQEKLASVYAFGIGYEASDKFFASAEITKEEDQPVNVNAGMQYKFLPQVLARLGIAATSAIWMGVGFSGKVCRFHVTASYHPQLGITPGLLLLFSFKQKED